MIASIDTAGGVQGGRGAENPSGGGDAGDVDSGAFAEQVAATAPQDDGTDLDTVADEGDDGLEGAGDVDGPSQEAGNAAAYFARGERADQVTAANGVAVYARNVAILEASQQILGTRFDMVL